LLAQSKAFFESAEDPRLNINPMSGYVLPATGKITPYSTFQAKAASPVSPVADGFATFRNSPGIRREAC
jgi:hypothetical protein